MGYVRKQKIYRLVFENGDLAGFVARVKSCSFGAIIDAGTDLEANTALLADCLVDWNLERADGSPVPCDLENLRAQDPPLINALIKAFSDAVFSVNDPLAQSSPAGPPSVEASLPMEPLSASRAS